MIFKLNLVTFIKIQKQSDIFRSTAYITFYSNKTNKKCTITILIPSRNDLQSIWQKLFLMGEEWGGSGWCWKRFLGNYHTRTLDITGISVTGRTVRLLIFIFNSKRFSDQLKCVLDWKIFLIQHWRLYRIVKYYHSCRTHIPILTYECIQSVYLKNNFHWNFSLYFIFICTPE